MTRIAPLVQEAEKESTKFGPEQKLRIGAILLGIVLVIASSLTVKEGASWSDAGIETTSQKLALSGFFLFFWVLPYPPWKTKKKN